jgi:hypothetical protein
MQARRQEADGRQEANGQEVRQKDQGEEVAAKEAADRDDAGGGVPRHLPQQVDEGVQQARQEQEALRQLQLTVAKRELACGREIEAALARHNCRLVGTPVLHPGEGGFVLRADIAVKAKGPHEPG